MAEALLAGGVDTLEVTCDSPGVLDMIRAIDAALGERVLLGAGTVLDAQTAQAALDAGAKFLVSPHTDAELVRSFTSRGAMWIPGAFTATRYLPPGAAPASSSCSRVRSDPPISRCADHCARFRFANGRRHDR
jgi:2-dehydro-3-deoxyphosphogluconate aldolase/(4S)-4-hydroxy-2-oxoglutarate aldolase